MPLNLGHFAPHVNENLGGGNYLIINELQTTIFCDIFHFFVAFHL